VILVHVLLMQEFPTQLEPRSCVGAALQDVWAGLELALGLDRQPTLC
jgi:hypothetical protein